MELKIYRRYCKDKYTIGKLYLIDGRREIWLSDTLEDKVRDLNRNGIFDNGEVKVYGETAIPYGKYEINMNTISPKFSQYAFYRNLCQGKLPRLINVPHFTGILIHVADGERGANLLKGCIAVGRNLIKGGLLEGKESFRKLYKLMNEANERGEQITIKIV